MNNIVRPNFKIFFLNKVFMGPVNSARVLLEKQKKCSSLCARDPQCKLSKKKKKKKKNNNNNNNNSRRLSKPHLSTRLDTDDFGNVCIFSFFSFFFLAQCMNSSRTIWLSTLFSTLGAMNNTRDSQISLFSNFSLKMSLTVLFTHLKIILLQYFQFSISAK